MSINAGSEMTSELSRERPEGGFLGLLRAAALIAVLAGAAGSVGLMLHASHRINSPRILRVLFALWVPSPFVGPLFATMVFKALSLFHPPPPLTFMRFSLSRSFA